MIASYVFLCPSSLYIDVFRYILKSLASFHEASSQQALIILRATLYIS